MLAMGLFSFFLFGRSGKKSLHVEADLARRSRKFRWISNGACHAILARLAMDAFTFLVVAACALR